MPSKIFTLFDIKTIPLEANESTKYHAAIQAIGRGEEPADFRGAMKKESLGIEGFNVLHCGISDAMRIYYVLHDGKAYILDVSNHYMNALNAAVQRFKKSIGQ